MEKEILAPLFHYWGGKITQGATYEVEIRLQIYDLIVIQIEKSKKN